MTMLERLERPSRELGLAYASQLFLAGERVDMQALAVALGVGRTTVYRWLGDREAVISEVLVGLAEQTWEQAQREARGRGLNRAVDVVRRFMAASASFEPLRTFVQQEPAPALRVLLDRDGVLVRWLQQKARLVARDVVPSDREGQQRIDDAIAICVSLLWPAVVIGRDPDLDAVVRVLRRQLLAGDGAR